MKLIAVAIRLVALTASLAGIAAPDRCLARPYADLAVSRSVAALVAAGTASTMPGTPKLANMSAQEFLAWHDAIDRELKSKRYEHVSISDLDEVALEQTRIRALVGTRASLDELSNEDQLAVFNAHERVVAIVEDAEGDRVICKRRIVVGSHRPISDCSTVSELKAAREGLGRDELFRQFPCTGSPPEAGSMNCPEGAGIGGRN